MPTGCRNRRRQPIIPRVRQPPLWHANSAILLWHQMLNPFPVSPSLSQCMREHPLCCRGLPSSALVVWYFIASHFREGLYGLPRLWSKISAVSMMKGCMSFIALRSELRDWPASIIVWAGWNSFNRCDWTSESVVLTDSKLFGVIPENLEQMLAEKPGQQVRCRYLTSSGNPQLVGVAWPMFHRQQYHPTLPHLSSSTLAQF